MTSKQQEQIKELIADTVGRLLANAFDVFNLKHTIRCKYEDTKGNLYRMTFEKLENENPEPC